MKKKKGRRIALVGTAQSSIHAPYDDESVEIWSVGYRSDHITRCTRHFEIHRLDALWDGPDWRPLLRKWAQDSQLVMFWPEPLGPDIYEYPLEQIKEKFGTYFMTSSFAWMLALAIWEHQNGSPVDEILIYGVDMEFGTEYREQRAGLRHFIYMAGFAGIKVTRLVNSGIIFEPIPYPFWMDNPLLQKLDSKEKTIEEERETKHRELEGILASCAAKRAIIEELNTIKGQEKRAETHKKALAILEKKIQPLRDDIAFCDGALNQTRWTADYLKP